ncbi:MAG TPA: phosphoglucomutase/phosphomannomutase family protein [Firmicutes bacterium]|nr:phosphoglucomutase/phosphomannomutase family protein [Bacillota bacterium]
MEIHFGTEGWRGIIADDFTFANVRRVGLAAARYLEELGAQAGVVVGYDTRFLSSCFAREIAGIMQAEGVEVYLADKPIVTPALSFAAAALGVDLGIMITASHNPPEYNGIKIKAADGGPVDQDVTSKIQELLPETAPSVPGKPSRVSELDLAGIYLDGVRKQVNKRQFTEAADLTVVVDSMYGAGAGYLAGLLAEYGVKVIAIRDETNPGFGGSSPEPIAANLRPLGAAVRKYRADLGLALDGDGDRLGVVDHRGEYVDSHRVFLLLLMHLVKNRGIKGTVVKTFSTSSVIDFAARSLGLAVRETPIGFKHIAAICRREPVLMGGEESGGYGFPRHLLDRDGILAGLLLVEYVAQQGKPLRSILDELAAEFGTMSYRRLDLPLKSCPQLCVEPPSRLGSRNVTAVETLDGLKLRLGDEGWILFRLSGTESVLRVYAEGKTEEAVREILRDGRQWIEDKIASEAVPAAYL